MQKTILINPSFEETQEMRVAIQDANKHFALLRNELFVYYCPALAKAKYNSLYGLFKEKTAIGKGVTMTPENLTPKSNGKVSVISPKKWR